MMRTLLFTLGLLLTAAFIHASEISDLEARVKTASDKEKPALYNQLSKAYLSGNPDISIEMGMKSAALAGIYNNLEAQADAYRHIGSAYQNLGNRPKAMEYFDMSREICLKSSNRQGLSYVLNNLGNMNVEAGNYNEALNFYLESLKIKEEIHDKKGMASTLNNIGEVSIYLGNYQDALKYCEQSLALRESMEDIPSTAFPINNLARTYSRLSNYTKALEYGLKSQEINRKSSNQKGLAESSETIGRIYIQMKEFGKALDSLNSSLKIRNSIGDKNGISMAYYEIGNAYFEQGLYQQAVSYYRLSLDIARNLNLKQIISDNYFALARIYEKITRYKEAYQFQSFYVNMKNELISEDNLNKISLMTAKYETERKKKEVELLQKEKEISRLRIQSLAIASFLLSGLLLLISLILFLLRRTSKKLQKAKNLLETERNLLRQKNEMIENELQMARSIQMRLLPHENPIPEIASFYNPMESLAGDFFDFIQFREPERIGIIIADVSGHGVPAALITSMLKTLVLQGGPMKTDPAALLMYLNELLFMHSNENFITALYGIYNPANHEFLFANAGHNPPYLISESGVEFLTGANRKMPLAVMGSEDLEMLGKKYENLTVTLQPGTKMLLYTDGLTEATNINNKEEDFENYGLSDVLFAERNKDSRSFIMAISDELNAFRGGNTYEDDICMVCLTVK